ncbi:hypothetical protein [Sphingomonas koreensis]|uniref:hypothetical protein n=1 Tax=Sphingomonas koreensis TaxID=93064 RepID=UPI00234F5533|nr:hypothetical protein [Sphingomonas koreensis]
MGRFLSVLLILLLALPHGPMSAGVPHIDGSTHGHVLVADHHDDDHDDESSIDTEIAQAALAAPADGDAGKAAHGMSLHIHVVSDGVPTSEYAFLDRRLARDRQLPVDDARLRSAALAPLPEPPSA